MYFSSSISVATKHFVASAILRWRSVISMALCIVILVINAGLPGRKPSFNSPFGLSVQLFNLDWFQFVGRQLGSSSVFCVSAYPGYSNRRYYFADLSGSMFRVQSNTQTKTTFLAATKFHSFLWKLVHTAVCICCLHGYWMLQTLHRSESFQKVSEKLWWVQWDQFHQPLWWPGQAGSETPKSLSWPRARTFGGGKSRGAEGGGAGHRHWGHSQWQIATRLHQGRGASKWKIKSRVWISDCAEEAPAQGGRVVMMHWKCEQCHTQYSNNYCNLLTGVLHKYTFPPLDRDLSYCTLVTVALIISMSVSPKL